MLMMTMPVKRRKRLLKEKKLSRAKRCKANFTKKIFALLRYQDSSTDVENVYHEEKQADGDLIESKKVISL